MGAISTNDSYLQAQYRRLKPRIGHGRALGAVKHSILCAIWHMLTTGELYRDLGGDYFRKRDPERQTKRLIAQLERLGHKVTLEALRRPPDASRNPPNAYTRQGAKPSGGRGPGLFSTQFPWPGGHPRRVKIALCT